MSTTDKRPYGGICTHAVDQYRLNDRRETPVNSRARRTPPLLASTLLLLASCLLLVPVASAAERDERIDRALAAGARGDVAEELSLWEQLGDEGDRKAMVSAGVIYQKGLGGTPDYEKSLDWYMKSMHDMALNNMGVMYRDGEGVPKNRRIAYLLFLFVHMQGNDVAAITYANRNLRQEVAELPKDEIKAALCYTPDYFKAYLMSHGALVGVAPDIRASADRKRFKDLGWWAKDEIKPYDCPADT